MRRRVTNAESITQAVLSILGIFNVGVTLVAILAASFFLMAAVSGGAETGALGILVVAPFAAGSAVAIALLWSGWCVLALLLEGFRTLRRANDNLSALRNGLSATHVELQEINASTLASYELSRREAGKI